MDSEFDYKVKQIINYVFFSENIMIVTTFTDIQSLVV